MLVKAVFGTLKYPTLSHIQIIDRHTMNNLSRPEKKNQAKDDTFLIHMLGILFNGNTQTMVKW